MNSILNPTSEEFLLVMDVPKQIICLRNFETNCTEDAMYKAMLAQFCLISEFKATLEFGSKENEA